MTDTTPQTSPSGRTAPATVKDGAGAPPPRAIHVWFSDIGTIRKWDTKPFDEGTRFIAEQPRPVPTEDNPFPNGEDRTLALMALRNLADAQQELLRYLHKGAVDNCPFGDAEVTASLAEAIVKAGTIERDILACQPYYAIHHEGLSQLIAAAHRFLSNYCNVDLIDPRDIPAQAQAFVDDITDEDVPF